MVLRLLHQKPVPVSGEIYLNGVYLLDYQNGQWHTAGPPSTNNGQFGFQQLQREPLPASGLVEQTIRLEAVTGQELFYVSPFISLGSNYEVQRDCGLEKLLRVEERPPTRYFQYALGTTAIVAGRHPRIVANPELYPVQPPARQLPENKNGVNPLRNLKALARRWIAESGLPEKDRLGRARWLEQNSLLPARSPIAWSASSATPPSTPSRTSSRSIRKGIASTLPPR